MKTETYHLKLITPCFCAGANQAQAEFRAPSIRGKLRWWFRILGASPADEALVFGSTAGNTGRAGALCLRTRTESSDLKWNPIEFGSVSNTGYVLYFAQASGNGIRWNDHGALPVGSRFLMQLVWRRRLPGPSAELFDLALRAFLMLGSLGLRGSRGLGVFECDEHPYSRADYDGLITEIKDRSPKFLSAIGEFSGSETKILDGLGAQLRGLRKGFSAGPPGSSNPTPLGSSQPRQASAVYLRPVRVAEDKYNIVVYEAPADKVLARASAIRAPRLGGGLPAPLNPPAGRPRR